MSRYSLLSAPVFTYSYALRVSVALSSEENGKSAQSFPCLLIDYVENAANISRVLAVVNESNAMVAGIKTSARFQRMFPLPLNPCRFAQWLETSATGIQNTALI